MPALIERFMPVAPLAECHDTLVAAPAEWAFEAARDLDLSSIPAIAGIFRLREWLLGSSPAPGGLPRGLVAQTLALGWGLLAERPNRELVMGAVTRPWEANVSFRAVEPERFADFREPDLVRIAWTLEADPIDATHSRLRTQTRAAPTDAAAARRLARYWRLFGVGIVLIRRLGLRAARRTAERRFRAVQALTAS